MITTNNGEFFVRENGKFEQIAEETANGLYHSDRQVFRLLTYTPYDKVFSLGIRGIDYFGAKQWNWKELPIETFNQ